MPIEFNCPYCTAAIRVPDSAGGKRGTCPKCATRLLVPVVEIPASHTVETVAPPAPIASPSEAQTPNVVAPVEPASANEISVGIPEISPVQSRTRKTGRRRPKRRKRNSGFLVLGTLAVLAIVVTGLLVVLYRPPARLEGSLVGRRIKSVNIAPGVLTANDVDVSAAQFAQAVESLQSEPLVLTSELVRTEIRGNDNVIEVDITMTSSADFVAVELKNTALQHYVSENALRFGKQRLTQLRTSATQLVTELSEDGKRHLTNPSGLRNTVALNLLRQGFGFVVDGAAGKLLCPCVYESGNQLWFAVPSGTTSFTIRGRTINKLGQQFGGRYQVAIEGQAETVIIETPDTMDEQDQVESIDPAMDSDTAEPGMSPPDEAME